MVPLIERARSGFRAAFGEPPALLVASPGRVNLIGEHTDYHDGLVFPAAIDRYIFVAARPVPGPSRLLSDQLGQAQPFDAANLDQAELTPWSRYAAGMAHVLGVTQNIEAYIVSDLPRGAGLSSSAAMEMAFGTLYDALAGLRLTDLELARAGQRCENEFVGVPCGLMDQLATKFGQAGHALLIDIRCPENLRPIPIPDGISLVVCDTGVKHQLGDSGYPARRRESEEAARLLGVTTLRDATNTTGLEDILERRARHVISEIARVEAFADALISGDRAEMGALMRASHESLRDDYEVSCTELDAMAQACWESGAIGARMTGGGFGGACIALVASGEVDRFVREAGARFREAAAVEANFHVCVATDGASVIE